MSVADLIEKLKAMPQDAVVIIRMCSEYDCLDENEPRLHRAEDKTMIWRNDIYMRWQDRWHDPDAPEPEFVTVCAFPGN